MSDSKIKNCISCNRPENVVPLVAITFASNPTWICTQCLPTLIHDPQKLADKFSDIDTNNPPEAVN